jgi:hypothetical protein
MANKTKIEFLNQIALEVKDVAGELSRTAITSGAGTLAGGLTTFAVNSTKDFNAGDEIYIDDKTANSNFTTVNSIVSATSIKITGDYSSILSGALIVKTDAVQHLSKALNVYSRYRPLEKIEKKAVAVSADSFDLPSDFETGFSQIKSIECPIGGNPLIILEKEDYRISLDDSNAYKLRFNYSINSDYKILYTLLHTFTNNIISANNADFYCICQIAAGYYLVALAARYGQSVSAALGADTVNYDTKPDQYRRLAKVLFGHAASWLGITEGEIDGSELSQAPAGSISNYEAKSPDNLLTLTHQRRLLTNN